MCRPNRPPICSCRSRLPATAQNEIPDRRWRPSQPPASAAESVLHELPDGGWDEVIRWAHEDRALGRKATAVTRSKPPSAGAGPRECTTDARRDEAERLDNGFPRSVCPRASDAKGAPTVFVHVGVCRDAQII